MKAQIVQHTTSLETIQSTIAKLREFKVNGYAMFDFVISYIAAFLLSFPLAKYISRKGLFYLVIPVSIIVHTLAGVHTPLTDQFWEPNSYYTIKLSAIYMLIKGLKYNPLSTLSTLYSKK